MTTVVDPAGAPIPIFNKSGTALITLAAAGTTQGAAAAIPHFAGEIVVLATVGPSDTAIALPVDAEIGDKVEVHCITASQGVKVFPPSGDTISEPSSGDGSLMVNVSNGNRGGVVFRKMTSTNWRYVGSAS